MLRAWSDMVAVGRHYGNASNLVTTFQPAADLALNVREDAGQRLTQFAVQAGEVGGEPAPTNSPAAAITPPTFAGVLQFDFGREDDDFKAPSPVPPAAGQAHGAGTRGTAGDFTLLPGETGRWNGIGPNGSARPLVFADGSPATGISVDLGRTEGAFSNVVNTNREPVLVLSIGAGNQRGGIYNSLLMSDALSGASISLGGSDSFAVRVLGLPAGYYYAVAMIGHGKNTVGRYDILTGTDHTHLDGFKVETLQTPSDFEANPTWGEGTNYVLGRVTLTAPGQELVVVSRATPPPSFINPPRFGQLSGLQIVRPQLRLLGFDAVQKNNQLGQEVELIWNVHYAEKLTLTGSDGFNADVTDRTNQRFVPSRTTIYTLTAENRNGPAQSRQVKVTIIGDSPQVDNVAAVIADAQNEDCDLRQMIQQCAESSRRGEECLLPIDEMKAKSEANDLEIIARLLAGDTCKKLDLDTALTTGHFIIDRAASRQEGGLGGDSLLPAFAAFMGCVSEEQSRRGGLVAILKADGTVDHRVLDTNLVATFSIPESTRLVRGLLDIQAQAALAGASVDIPTDLLAAHAENILRKIIASIPANQPVASRLADKRNSELSGFVRGYQVASSAIGHFQEGGVNPPLIAAGESAMAGVAQTLLARLDEEFVRFRDDPFAFLARRGFWANQFFAIQDLNTLNGTNNARFNLDSAIRERTRRVLEIIDRESESNGELQRLEPEVLRFAQRFLSDATFRTLYERQIVRGLQFIASRLPATRPWTSDEFDKAPTLVGELADLHLLIKEANKAAIQLTIPGNVRVEFLARTLILNAEEATRRSATDPAGTQFSIDAIRHPPSQRLQPRRHREPPQARRAPGRSALALS